jgi:hypothetical protein
MGPYHSRSQFSRHAREWMAGALLAAVAGLPARPRIAAGIEPVEA